MGYCSTDINDLNTLITNFKSFLTKASRFQKKKDIILGKMAIFEVQTNSLLKSKEENLNIKSALELLNEFIEYFKNIFKEAVNI